MRRQKLEGRGLRLDHVTSTPPKSGRAIWTLYLVPREGRTTHLFSCLYSLFGLGFSLSAHLILRKAITLFKFKHQYA